MGLLMAKMPGSVMLLCALMATVFVLIYAFLYLVNAKRYENYFDRVDEKIFIFKDMYYLGFGVIELQEKLTRRRITDNAKAYDRVRELIEIFGRNSAEWYFYVERAGMLTMLVICLPLCFLAGCISGMYIGLFLGILIGMLLVNGIRSNIQDRIKEKKEEIDVEFPQMISKMTLLINAGMAVRQAWKNVSHSNSENKLYQEMLTTTKDIEEGMAVEDAIMAFASRCASRDVRKFASLYIQAIQKGAGESIQSMKEMSEEAWENKKQTARQKGATAAQKLTAPNMLIFVGLLFLVVGPMGISLMNSFSL